MVRQELELWVVWQVRIVATNEGSKTGITVVTNVGCLAVRIVVEINVDSVLGRLVTLVVLVA